MSPIPTTPIRVLIADDSPTSRATLSGLFHRDPALEVVGEACNGVEAVELTRRLRPSVVVMDLHMPVTDGLEATRLIMTETPTPVILVTAVSDPRAVDVAMEAMAVGALTVLPKPFGARPGEDAEAFLSRIKLLSEVKVIRRHPHRSTTRPDRSPSRFQTLVGQTRPQIRIVVIAASTGGPLAIQRLLAALPEDFGAPVAVVQHIVKGFVGGFVSWLDANVPLRAKVAEHGEPLLAGSVYLAPDDRHLKVVPQQTAWLDDGPPVGGFRPSATALLESAAATHRQSVAAVVLTGMGVDGLAGARLVKECGGVVLAQDEATCVVFGMPGAVAAAGLAHEVAPVGVLAERIGRLAPKRHS